MAGARARCRSLFVERTCIHALCLQVGPVSVPEDSALCCKPSQCMLIYARRRKGDFNLLIKFGAEFGKARRKDPTPRPPLRLLYTGGNHYDLLLE